MDSNLMARNIAMIRSNINELEQELKEVDAKTDDVSVRLYKHTAEAQLDSLRLTQLMEDVNSIQSSLRYASRSIAAAAATAVFGILVAILSSGIGMEIG
ncbi:MAG: hypothetical protein ACO2ZE_12360 [Pseudohongiellaceae bacterium]